MNPICVALDTTDLDYARGLAERLRGSVGGLKLGLEFFSAHGPEGVRAFSGMGLPLFLDLKFHDIPNTVAGACRAVLKAAGDAARAVNPGIKVIAVTVLTSLNETDLKSMGIAGAPGAQVLRLAQLSKTNGLDGVVCSAHEIVPLRAGLGGDFLLVVPGIRPAGSDLNDQSRVMTPAEAHKAGADILVIGRPITAAPDPVKAARDIAQSLGF